MLGLGEWEKRPCQTCQLRMQVYFLHAPLRQVQGQSHYLALVEANIAIKKLLNTYNNIFYTLMTDFLKSIFLFVCLPPLADPLKALDITL